MMGRKRAKYGNHKNIVTCCVQLFHTLLFRRKFLTKQPTAFCLFLLKTNFKNTALRVPDVANLPHPSKGTLF